MPFADMPTVICNIETPSGAGAAGYCIFDDATYGKFNTAKFAGPAFYADRSSNLRAMRTARGSSDPTDAIFHAQTGTASAVLDNRTRLFDPTNNADVRPHRAVQFQAVWNAVTYTLFTGTIPEWQLDYPGRSARSDATTTIGAVDGTQFFVDLNILDPLAEQSTGSRVNSILDLAGWPSGSRTVTAGATLMPAHIGTISGWQALLEAADSELGEIFVGADGKVVFRDRATVITETRSTTSQATFGDAGGELPFYDVSVAYDDKRIRNDIEIVYNERNDTAFARDALSIARYGYKPYQLQLSIADGNVARNIAALLVRLYSTPFVRIDTLVLKPRRSPTGLWPQALGRQIGDRITVKITPPGGGSRIVRDSVIRGIAHEMSPQGEWTTTWVLQDATLFGTYIKFNVSAFDGTDTFFV